MGLLENRTGEPCAVKAASTVRRGGVGKVLSKVTHLLPTLLHAEWRGGNQLQCRHQSILDWAGWATAGEDGLVPGGGVATAGRDV